MSENAAAVIQKSCISNPPKNSGKLSIVSAQKSMKIHKTKMHENVIYRKRTRTSVSDHFPGYFCFLWKEKMRVSLHERFVFLINVKCTPTRLWWWRLWVKQVPNKPVALNVRVERLCGRLSYLLLSAWIHQNPLPAARKISAFAGCSAAAQWLSGDRKNAFCCFKGRHIYIIGWEKCNKNNTFDPFHGENLDELEQGGRRGIHGDERRRVSFAAGSRINNSLDFIQDQSPMTSDTH